MREGYDEAPLNPLPLAVWVLVMPIAAMEIVLQAGAAGFAGGGAGAGWRNEALQRLALSPEMLDRMVEAGRYPAEILMRFAAYPLVHGSFVHALFAVVFILALGKMVGEVFRLPAVLAVFLGSAVAAALAYSLVPGIRQALFGAYPPVYGLVGAFTYILWARLGALHANRARAFTLIAMLLIVQTIFTALNQVMNGVFDASIVADFTGFVAGFALSVLVAPGGPARLMERLRQR